MNDERVVGGIGISGLCILWGIVTQCLNWAGVLQWPWYAYWGPLLFIIGIWVIAIVVSVIIALMIGSRY